MISPGDLADALQSLSVIKAGAKYCYWTWRTSSLLFVLRNANIYDEYLLDG